MVYEMLSNLSSMQHEEPQPVRWWLSGCGKCGGDLRGEEDEYGKGVVCVQCGKDEVVPLTVDEADAAKSRIGSKRIRGDQTGRPPGDRKPFLLD